MPVLKSRKKRRKKVRFKEVKLKLSKNQQRSLDNYCKARKTTPNKLIKKMIRRFLTNYSKDIPEESFVTANQLDLFNEDHL
ncbi:MAG: hypothetical protein M0Q51_13035 [Bacteroidales bacterium]|nr:hypothetical protein [Bacteroidales bacterium]